MGAGAGKPKRSAVIPSLSASGSTKPEDDKNRDADPPEPISEEEMKQKLEEQLKSYSELYQQTPHYWTLKLSQTTEFDRQDFRNHVRNLRQSYPTFNDEKYSQRLRFHYLQKAAESFVSSGSVPVLCDLILEILQKRLSYTEDEASRQRSLDHVQAELLEDALNVLIDFAEEQVTCLAIIGHQNFIPDLLEQLQRIKKLHSEGQINLAESMGTVLDCLLILYQVSCHEENVEYMRKLPGLMDLLKTSMAMDDRDWKFYSLITLAAIATDAEADELATNSDMLDALLSLTSELQDKKNPFSIKLVHAFKNLSKNNSNSRQLVEKGALPLLTKALQSDIHKERKVCIESLWGLSFLEKNRGRIAARKDLLDLVVGIYRNKEDPCQHKACQRAAEGVLFQLRHNLRHHQNKQYTSLVEQLQGGRDTQSKTSGHVMLSYTKGNRPVVEMVYDYLAQNGIPMWMDIHNMAEGEDSTLQTMAEAVEGSFVFLMCYSESYKNSQYCRQEADYASAKKKTIIPLKMQSNYEPDGWLGFILGTKYFFDFSRQELYDKSLTKLLKNIQKSSDKLLAMGTTQKAQAQHPVGMDTSHGGPLYPSPAVNSLPLSSVKQIRQWGKVDVTKWLHKFDLKGESLEALTGLDIVFLRHMYDRAPDCFYHVVHRRLCLKQVTDMSRLAYALEEVHTMF